MTTSTQSWYESLESQMARARVMVDTAARRWRAADSLLEQMLADPACEHWHEDIACVLQDVGRRRVLVCVLQDVER